MILATYFLSLLNMGKVKLDDSVNISSVIDLRRYIHVNIIYIVWRNKNEDY